MAVTVIHPGEHLAEELRELEMSAAELARQLEVPTNRITEIVNGRRGITGDTALRLAHLFGTSAEFWLNLQSLYEIRLAQQKSGKSIKSLPTLKGFEAGAFLDKCRSCSSSILRTGSFSFFHQPHQTYVNRSISA